MEFNAIGNISNNYIKPQEFETKEENEQEEYKQIKDGEEKLLLAMNASALSAQAGIKIKNPADADLGYIEKEELPQDAEEAEVEVNAIPLDSVSDVEDTDSNEDSGINNVENINNTDNIEESESVEAEKD